MGIFLIDDQIDLIEIEIDRLIESIKSITRSISNPDENSNRPFLLIMPLNFDLPLKLPIK
jgi:hypothetical protein